MNMKLNMNNGRARFFKLNTVIHELICVLNYFYPATIKNDKGAVAMGKTFVWRKQKQQLHQFKKEAT